MKSRNLFLWIIILFIGVVALMASMGTIEFSWRVAWKLWPMLLVFVGIALLPLKEWMKALLLLIAIAIGVWLYQVEARKEADKHNSGWVNPARRLWNWIDEDVYDVY